MTSWIHFRLRFSNKATGHVTMGKIFCTPKNHRKKKPKKGNYVIRSGDHGKKYFLVLTKSENSQKNSKNYLKNSKNGYKVSKM